MKKKVLLSVLLVGLLAFGAGMGTLAYFQSQFKSVGSVIQAAEWDIEMDDLIENTNGTVTSEFDVPYFAPGMSNEMSLFIRSGATNVDRKITVKVEPKGDLFTNINYPFIFNVNHSNGPGAPTLVEDNKVYTYEFYRTKEEIIGTEYISVEYEWPFDSSPAVDKSLEGLAGTMDVTVTVTQVKPEDMPASYTQLSGDARVNAPVDGVKRNWSPFQGKIDENNVPIEMKIEDPNLGTIEFELEYNKAVNEYNLAKFEANTPVGQNYLDKIVHLRFMPDNETPGPQVNLRNGFSLEGIDITSATHFYFCDVSGNNQKIEIDK
ncbi:MAG: hypothetical protein FH753_09910 [Firmicutes bacterium]|nr:hypothetical protein [Bacillota bacterium]